MGACDFTDYATGKNADEAFQACVKDAQYEFGHGGYSGTIAEKGSFIRIATDTVPSRDEGFTLAYKLIADDDPRISDKWGPAGCIAVSDGGYVFFGWASS